MKLIGRVFFNSVTTCGPRFLMLQISRIQAVGTTATLVVACYGGCSRRTQRRLIRDYGLDPLRDFHKGEQIQRFSRCFGPCHRSFVTASLKTSSPSQACCGRVRTSSVRSCTTAESDKERPVESSSRAKPQRQLGPQKVRQNGLRLAWVDSMSRKKPGDICRSVGQP